MIKVRNIMKGREDKVTLLVLISVLLFILLMNVGCQSGVTVTTSSSLFYPDVKTSKGGEFKDPGGRGSGLGFGSLSFATEGIGNFDKK